MVCDLTGDIQKEKERERESDRLDQDDKSDQDHQFVIVGMFRRKKAHGPFICIGTFVQKNTFCQRYWYPNFNDHSEVSEEGTENC